ncbi:helix-turn-helix domain-containing protein [Sphingomonas sp.]|uniref:winged helix-turn-helix transcriptional regulator n=1 Tax=Sphingomonas sp. TaxID=28214 RepID=UPI0025F35CAD|nr:helix-turn-helix domain-containing protein [Sphingomonas sp.]
MELEKVTKSLAGDDKRRYDDACGLAHALELVGERWAMLILRELAYGPRRFSGLKADLSGISANVLTQRLAELERRGIVRKTRLPPPASVQVYEATEWGLEIEPLIGALGKWAARSPNHNPTLPMSPVSLMMSLQTLFSPERAAGLEARVGFRLGESEYVASVGRERVDIERTDAAGSDVIFSGNSNDVTGVIHGGAPFETITVEGDLGLAKRFLTLFPLPPKAG